MVTKTRYIFLEIIDTTHSIRKNFYENQNYVFIMDESLRQRFRQPFGYFMEDLITDHFNSIGTLCLNHNFNQIYEWKDKLTKESIPALMKFYDRLDYSRDIAVQNRYSSMVDKLSGKGPAYFDFSKLNEFLMKHKKINDEKLKLLVIASLLGDNTIELLRVEGGQVIVSEIKSQYGPKPDFKIELTAPQLNLIFDLNEIGIVSTLIYLIAFPEPSFIEIPTIELYKIFEKYDDWNGYSFNEQGSIRIRMPKGCRERSNYVNISDRLYNYDDDLSLFKEILAKYNGQFKRLEDELSNRERFS